MLRNLNYAKALQNIVLLCLFVIAGCQPSLTPAEGMQRAEAYRNEGNYREAIIELKNVLRNSPQHRETRLMLGELYLLQRDGDSAVTQLHKARDLGPDEIDIRASYGRALLLQEKYDRLLEEIVADEADSPATRADLLLLRGYAYFFKNDLQQADQLLLQALMLDENNPAALTGRALVYLGNKNDTKASQLVEQAIGIDAEYMDAWFLKGKLALIQKQYKLAEQAFGRAVDSISHGFTFLPPVQAHTFLVQSLVDQKKLKLAEQAVKQLAIDHPGHPVLHYLRALIAYEKGDFEKAGEHIQVIRSKAPDYDPALMLEGAISYALGNYERGNRALTAYLARHPDSSAARKLLVAIRLKLQQPELAYEAISPLLSQDPDNVELLSLASTAMRKAGKSEQSIPLIEKALQKDPENIDLKMQLALARLSIGDAEQAILILQALPPTADKFGKREMMLLLAWSREKDYKTALEFVDGYIAAHPGDAEVLAHSGVILMRMGKPDAARERFEKSLALKPDSSQLLRMFARLEYLEKNYPAAEKLLARLLEMEPDNAGVLYALANISAIKGDKDKAITWLERSRQASESAFEPRLLLVKYYLQQGNIGKAKELSLEATKIAPERADVWNTYSVVQNNAGDPQGAVDSLLKAEKLKPDSRTILMNLARSQVSISDVAGAGVTLRKLLKLSPDNFQVASMLAVIEMKQGNAQQAFDLARRQQASTENRSKALALEGDLHMMAAAYNKAVDVYRAAAKISPSTGLTVKRYNASRAAALSKPERILLEWLQKHPQDTTIRSLLASGYLASGDADRATQEYETLLAQKPDDPNTLNNLAYAYSLQKDPKAVATAEKAHSLKPDSAAIKDTLGWILVQQGDVKRSVLLLREAVSQLPDNMEIQYHYAVALAESGDQGGARKILQKLVDSKSSFAASADAKKYLQTLTP